MVLVAVVVSGVTMVPGAVVARDAPVALDAAVKLDVAMVLGAVIVFAGLAAGASAGLVPVEAATAAAMLEDVGPAAGAAWRAASVEPLTNSSAVRSVAAPDGSVTDVPSVESTEASGARETGAPAPVRALPPVAVRPSLIPVASVATPGSTGSAPANTPTSTDWEACKNAVGTTIGSMPRAASFPAAGAIDRMSSDAVSSEDVSDGSARASAAASDERSTPLRASMLPRKAAANSPPGCCTSAIPRRDDAEGA
jgi:hypothetical protein